MSRQQKLFQQELQQQQRRIQFLQQQLQQQPSQLQHQIQLLQQQLHQLQQQQQQLYYQQHQQRHRRDRDIKKLQLFQRQLSYIKGIIYEYQITNILNNAGINCNRVG
jgi:hypothetical protein